MGLDIGPGGSNRPKVLGIIGFGRIGQAVARRSRGFKMKVIAFDPPLKALIEKTRGVSYRDLEDLLRESDFVSIHCPLTAETHHLIGPKELKLMKPTAVLINTARGPIVDEKALLCGLEAEEESQRQDSMCTRRSPISPRAFHDSRMWSCFPISAAPRRIPGDRWRSWPQRMRSRCSGGKGPRISSTRRCSALPRTCEGSGNDDQGFARCPFRT